MYMDLEQLVTLKEFLKTKYKTKLADDLFDRVVANVTNHRGFKTKPDTKDTTLEGKITLVAYNYVVANFSKE